LESEIVVIITGLVGAITFMLGSWFSPRTKALKEEIGYWRGVAGNFKKEVGISKRELSKLNVDELEGLLPEKYGFLKPVISQVLENPEMLQGLINKFLPQLQKGNTASVTNTQGQVWQ
jgi:hypothetical protein